MCLQQWRRQVTESRVESSALRSDDEVTALRVMDMLERSVAPPSDLKDALERPGSSIVLAPPSDLKDALERPGSTALAPPSDLSVCEISSEQATLHWTLAHLSHADNQLTGCSHVTSHTYKVCGCCVVLQCFDTVGWASGGASGL